VPRISPSDRSKKGESALIDPGDYGNRLHVRKDKTNPRRVAYLALLLFASPSHWFWVVAGLLAGATGIALHGWAAGYMARAGYAERKKELTIFGPYRHNRNPYYLAQMTLDLGVFMLAGYPLFYLFYFPVIFFVYERWVKSEESFLENEFGEDYRILKRHVPRWWFRLTPAPARGAKIKFRWATFMLNRELPRTLSHLCLLGVLVLFHIFGNPSAQFSVAARVTVVAAIAVWLILHDVYLPKATYKSPACAIVPLCSALLTMVLLTWAPLWEPWLGASAWVSIVVGLSLGLLVCLTAMPSHADLAPSIRRKVFVQPICQWYALALGLGLLSCTLAGVWLGIMASFTVWALQIAGWVSVQLVPQRFNVSISIMALVFCLGSLAVARQLT
jgi:protein-S-isoprenylcysteine O-methyltransferase Ste14